MLQRRKARARGYDRQHATTIGDGMVLRTGI
jgi:hypothetical protein